MVRAYPPALRVAAWIFVLLAAFLLLAPLAVVVAVSVSASQFITFPPQGLSLDWYRKALASPAYLDAFWLSLRLAVLVTLGATVIGAASAIALSRHRKPGGGFETFFLSPLVLPTIIFAIGMLMLWSSVFGATSFLSLWVAHTVVALPYVIRTTLAVLAESDPFLEEAARTARDAAPDAVVAERSRHRRGGVSVHGPRLPRRAGAVKGKQARGSRVCPGRRRP